MRIQCRPAPLWAFAFVLLLAACGGKAVSQRANDALGRTLAAANAARSSFIAYDKDHQQDIVDRSTSAEEAKAALARYRSRRAKVLDAFTKVYTVLGATAALIPLIERGEKRDLELTAALVEIIVAFDAVKTAVKELKE